MLLGVMPSDASEQIASFPFVGKSQEREANAVLRIIHAGDIRPAGARADQVFRVPKAGKPVFPNALRAYRKIIQFRRNPVGAMSALARNNDSRGSGTSRRLVVAPFA